MKTATMMAALMAAAVATAGDSVTNGPAIPAPRTDWAGGSYQYLMNEMSRSVRGQRFDMVIFGDSITMGWIYPEADKGWPGGCEVWQRHFGKMLTANFGISGDRTEHVLWRIVSAGQADGWQAKTIVLMIGINNHGQTRSGWAASDTPAQAAEGAKAIVAALRARHPEARLIVLGALPWASNDGFRWVREYNALLKGLCDGKTVFFRDIGGAFLDAPDVQKKALFRDGLHPNPAGYEVYAAELGKVLRGL